MADAQDSGERTEQPTAKRLRDARRRGEVDRGREIAPTTVLLVMTALVGLFAGDAGARFAGLMQLVFDSIGRPFEQAAADVAWAAATTLVGITLSVAVPVALVAVLAEFLNVGPVFSARPMTPDLTRLDPVAGLKRMVGADHWIELVRSIVKTVLLVAIAVLVSRALLPRLGSLHRGSPEAFGEALRSGLLQLLGWTVAVFAVVAIADLLYQRYAFRRKMRMSLRDIRREVREDSGDPMFKQHRRQQQRDWAQRSEVAAAREAHLLVVNPTHVAIALDWHPEHVPVPVLTGKGEDRVALRMRAVAEEAAVPVLRDVPLARALLEHGAVGEAVPEELFDAVAQAIVWAQRIREQGEPQDGGQGPANAAHAPATPPAASQTSGMAGRESLPRPRRPRVPPPAGH